MGLFTLRLDFLEDKFVALYENTESPIRERTTSKASSAVPVADKIGIGTKHGELGLVLLQVSLLHFFSPAEKWVNVAEGKLSVLGSDCPDLVIHREDGTHFVYFSVSIQVEMILVNPILKCLQSYELGD